MVLPKTFPELGTVVAAAAAAAAAARSVQPRSWVVEENSQGSLKYITAAARSVLAAAGADGALVLIAADPAARPHSKYVPGSPGARPALGGGVAQLEGPPEPQTA